MFVPIIKEEQLYVVNGGAGDTALCILWSNNKEELYEKHSKHFDIAVIGNLYSNDGIDDMFRNLYANPDIKNLIIDGIDYNDMFNALVSYMHYGKKISWSGGKDGMLLIPTHINVFNDIGRYIRKATTTLERAAYFTPPVLKKEADNTVDEPGHLYKRDSLQDVYYEAAEAVLLKGRYTPSRWGDTKELTGVTIVYSNYKTMYSPTAQKYAEDMFLGSEDKNTSYNYGERLNEYYGLKEIMAKLSENPARRDGYLPIFVIKDVFEKQSPPCLTSVSFRSYGGKLYSYWNMRSNDLVKAAKLNYYAFGYITERLAKYFAWDIGKVTVNVASLHIYQNDINTIQQELENYHKDYVYREEFDSSGYFLIDVKDGQIYVAHKSVCGKVTNTFTGTSAELLSRKLQPLIGSIEHAMYVGRALQEAENKLNKENYCVK